MSRAGRVRLKEWGKDLLIVLLACSAIYLAVQSQLPTSLRGLLGEPQPLDEPGASLAGEQLAMARPVRITATAQSGESTIRYGVQYDRDASDALFQRVASLLVEALSSPGQAAAVTQREWRTALTSAPSLYFYLPGQMPLSVLSHWLGGEDVQADCIVQRLALATVDGRVKLYYQNLEDGKFYAREAEVVNIGLLQAALSGLTDNGALFAFESEQYALLEPYTLLLPSTPSPPIYSAANPLSSEAGLTRLLEALDFQSASLHIYTSPDGQVVRSGNDTLRVSDRGVVTYHTTEGMPSLYSMAGATRYDAVEGCRQLAAEAVGPLCGEARLVLSQVQPVEGGGWQVSFDYDLNGALVNLYTGGHAARFLVQDSHVVEFSMQLRSYAETGDTSLVLPENQALAAMAALELEGCELLLSYADGGGELVSAGWVAR